MAVADAVTEQLPVGSGGGGELVNPAGDADREQRTPIHAGVDLGISRWQMPQRGADHPDCVRGDTPYGWRSAGSKVQLGPAQL